MFYYHLVFLFLIGGCNSGDSFKAPTLQSSGKEKKEKTTYNASNSEEGSKDRGDEENISGGSNDSVDEPVMAGGAFLVCRKIASANGDESLVRVGCNIEDDNGRKDIQKGTPVKVAMHDENSKFEATLSVAGLDRPWHFMFEIERNLAEKGKLQIDLDSAEGEGLDLNLPDLGLPSGKPVADEDGAEDDDSDSEDEGDEEEEAEDSEDAEEGKPKGKTKAGVIQSNNPNCCYLLCGKKDYKKGDIWGYKEKEGYSCIVPKSSLDSGKSCDKPVASCSM